MSLQRPRCLIIQLSELGETIQSLMALRAVKQLYPELEVEFLARESFSDAAKRIPWINAVHVLPADDVIASIQKGDKAEAEVVSELARWVRPVIEEPWDFVVNWTYSEASSWLAGLIPATVTLGYSRRKDKTLSCEDGWSHYIQGVVHGEVRQNIHLTDILTTQLLTALQIHLGEPSDQGNVPVTSKEFFSIRKKDSAWSRRDTSRRWIAFQLSTANKKERWPVSSWVDLALGVLKRHPETGIVVLADADQKDIANEFLDQIDDQIGLGDRVLDFSGQEDFDLWASIVGGCQWVFSSDSAIVHLASVLGTRVLGVSQGPIRFAETGPYGNGHYIVSGRNQSIPPGALYGVWSYANGEWSHRQRKTIEEHFELLGHEELLGKVSIFRSKIRASNEGGGVVYELVLRRPLSTEDWVGIVMGQVARAWYCGWVSPVGLELSREQVSPQLLKELREMEESASVLLKVCREAVSTSVHLVKKSSSLRSQSVMSMGDKKAIESINDKLNELRELMDRLSKIHPPFKAFSQMSQVMNHNLEGKTVSDLATESAESYRQLAEGMELFIDWLRFTLNLARPVEVGKVRLLHQPKELDQ